MGTFHHDRSTLHGITVVVETTGPRVVVGRCDDVTDAGVILHDADVHETEGGRAEFLRSARAYGVWPRHRTLVVPAAEVRSITRLGDLAAQ